MRYTLILKPGVNSEIKDAYDWFEFKDPGLGMRFIEELEDYLQKITLHPDYFSFSDGNMREAVLDIFSYKIIFEVIDHEVVVFAVFHTSRRPKNF